MYVRIESKRVRCSGLNHPIGDVSRSAIRQLPYAEWAAQKAGAAQAWILPSSPELTDDERSEWAQQPGSLWSLTKHSRHVIDLAGQALHRPPVTPDK